MTIKTVGGVLLAVVGLGACSSMSLPGIVPSPLLLPSRASDASTIAAREGPTGLRVETVPSAPAAAPPRPKPGDVTRLDPTLAAPSELAVLNLEQVSLGTFAQLVYSEILKRNVSVDPKVLERRDLVTFRTAESQSASQLDRAVRQLLKSYGVSVVDYGGVIRVLPDDASGAVLPEIRRGSALPESPLPLRPVFHLIDVTSVRPGDVATWIRTVFGDKVKIQEDPTRNAVLVSGNADTMEVALEAIRVLDQPVMAGRKSIALYPSYWAADELARRLSDVLGAEGYAVQPIGQTAAAGRFPVILLPLASLNAILVFASSETVTQHIAEWAIKLDRPNERGIGKNYFTYAVKHKDAAVLAQTLEQLMGGAAPVAAAPAAAGAPAAGSTRSAGGRVVVDKGENTLIFQANAEEYSQLTALLEKLDRPTRSALIEVTVAELAVDDSSQLGIEFLFNQSLPGGSRAVGGTLGGLSLGNSGFNYSVFGSAGGIKLALNALAAANKATILSSPRITARNGETATIQVGQEVPIITSQQSTTTAATPTNAAIGILQTIQYRTTGVVLRVKPVIHSGDQIDLDISQEVSAAQSTNTGVNNSPTFSTRKVETKLTLTNGSTVLLGGLISSDTSSGDSGIPYLKDLPGIGSAFKTQNTATRRRELIVLITPYVMNDQRDAKALTEAFRDMLGPWAKPQMPTIRVLPTPGELLPQRP